MNFRKTLAVAICAFIPLINASCSTVKKDQTGLDFTIVSVDYDYGEETRTYSFNYIGTGLMVYWGDGVVNDLNYHTYHDDGDDSFIIAGDITSISFCDENGNFLSTNNREIDSVVFSKTIKDIPSRAFYGIPLDSAFIPTSVETIGYAAFSSTQNSTVFMCSAYNKPNNWDAYWDLNVQFQNMYVWGVSIYTDDSCAYILINTGDVKSAIALLCIDQNPDAIHLNIPNTVIANGVAYDVTIISDSFAWLVDSTLVEVTIPSNVEIIGSHAFDNCYNLSKITFDETEGPSHLKTIHYMAFAHTNIKSIRIPKSTQYIHGCFIEGCGELRSVFVDEFTDKNEIAACNGEAFEYGPRPINFYYRSDKVSQKYFVEKGWPEPSDEFKWIY